LTLIEAGLTAIAFAVSFALPRLGRSAYSRIEQAFVGLSRRKSLSVVVVGVAALVLRLAILPICPIPLPFVADDFSFLLAADTFFHGRLTNPTPVMWIHFETIHETMVPTYQSMYFPAQGLLLASGKLLFGNPWFALLISAALMCAALCWMLQAWLPATWAFLGGVIAVIHIGLFSYWVNTYHAGGTLIALGGALLLGAFPRMMKTPRYRYALLMGIAVVLLACTRPYEGLLLCLPVAFVLFRWMFRGANRPSPATLVRMAIAPVLVMVAGAAWMGYYDYRAFGSPLTLPYTVNRAQYAIAPYYVWQNARPEPAYRHAEMRRFYHIAEMDYFEIVHNRLLFVPATMFKAFEALLFYAGFALLPPLLMVRRVFLDRRVRFLVLSACFLACGMVIEIFLIAHYVAPFTAAFYAIGLQCMRHLRVWKPESKPVGLTQVRLCITLVFLMAGLRLAADPLHLTPPLWPPPHWNSTWYGPAHFGTERARVESELEQKPGTQLAIVRYTGKNNPIEEWVYNDADIDTSKVVWAREMDAANNRELMQYYRDRKVWLIQPDTAPASVTPYPQQLPAAGDH
jgi:hypothetical protein